MCIYFDGCYGKVNTSIIEGRHSMQPNSSLPWIKAPFTFVPWGSNVKTDIDRIWGGGAQEHAEVKWEVGEFMSDLWEMPQFPPH